MASKITNESAATPEAAAKSAARAEKKEARAHRKEARAQKSTEAGRHERAAVLCKFTHVDVKKSDEGFQFSVRGAERRFKFTLAPQEAGPILKDLESAIQVVRGQI